MKNSIEYLDKIVTILEPPYFKEMGYYGIRDDELEYVMSKVYGYDIKIGIGIHIFDPKNGNTLYTEYKGTWFKYDENGKRI
jgi:hypothetical protein